MSWHQLPYHFKRDVVLHLDCKSRSQILTCLKQDKCLVESCPIKLDLVRISSFNDHELRILSKEKPSDVPTSCVGSVEHTIDKFLSIFQNSKSMASSVSFLFDYETIEKTFYLHLESETVERKLKIKTQKLKIYNTFETVRSLSQTLSCFDANVLRQLELGAESYTYLTIPLVETEQWRNLDKIEIISQHGVDITMDHFLHFNKLTLPVKQLSMMDAWKLLKNFIDKDSPIGSYFEIFIRDLTDFHRVKQGLVKKIEEAIANGEISRLPPARIDDEEGLEEEENDDNKNIQDNQQEDVDIEQENHDQGGENHQNEDEDSEDEEVDEEQIRFLEIITRIIKLKMKTEQHALVIDIQEDRLIGFVSCSLHAEYQFARRIQYGTIAHFPNFQ